LKLIQIVDAAVAEAVGRGGGWLRCEPGCSQCCVGVFGISQVDAAELRVGLGKADPVTAARVRARATASVERLAPWFPGDLATGVLGESEEAVELFEEYANDEVCAALDPESGTCDLYASRPVLCRTFGPPMPSGDGDLAVCELCFEGADQAEIERCAIDPSFVEVEERMIEEHAERTGLKGRTLVAFALAQA